MKISIQYPVGGGGGSECDSDVENLWYLKDGIFGFRKKIIFFFFFLFWVWFGGNCIYWSETSYG